MIITGADSKCEWLLPWWYGNFKKHNNLEVTICDFGLSEKALNWCEKKNLKVQKVGGGKGWHLKPSALRSVNAKKRIWIDVDIEIRGSIKEIYNYIEENKLATSLDEFHSWGCKYQTGIVGVQDDPEILQLWEKSCKNPTGPYARGDQELLWELVQDENRFHAWNQADVISNIPLNFNWLRISVEKKNLPEDLRAIHWTGDRGKKIIMKAIRNRVDTLSMFGQERWTEPNRTNPTSGGIFNSTSGGEII